jgi:hypothetical protein
MTIRYGVDNPVTLLARYDKLTVNLYDIGLAQAQPLGLLYRADKARHYTFVLN